MVVMTLLGTGKKEVFHGFLENIYPREKEVY
jgi:hypothetical protein